MGSKKRSNPEYPPELMVESIPSEGQEIRPLYRVYLLNDDYTPMGFVIEVLERYFSMTHNIAMDVMLQVHQTGKAICGVFTQEIAETKVLQVNEYSRRNQHPLLCQMEQSGTN